MTVPSDYLYFKNSEDYGQMRTIMTCKLTLVTTNMTN